MKQHNPSTFESMGMHCSSSTTKNRNSGNLVTARKGRITRNERRALKFPVSPPPEGMKSSMPIMTMNISK
eukprot:3702572-Rhodomonas_salina.3